MARVVVIGGSGHVGTYLVPMLVEAGHERRQCQPRARPRPTRRNAAWERVETVVADRPTEEAGRDVRREAELPGSSSPGSPRS